jgi:hypothetical protein
MKCDSAAATRDSCPGYVAPTESNLTSHGCQAPRLTRYYAQNFLLCKAGCDVVSGLKEDLRALNEGQAEDVLGPGLNESLWEAEHQVRTCDAGENFG